MEIHDAPLFAGDDVFLLNPAHIGFVTGENRRFAPGGSVMRQGCVMIFLIPFLLIGIGVAAFGIHLAAEWRQITANGVVVSGQFMDRSISIDSDGDSVYNVTYGYQHDGRLYTRHENVASDIYTRAEPGALADVVYVPANPTVARLAETNEVPQIGFIFVFSLCWNLLVWPIFLGMIVGIYGSRTLARKGRVIPGEVISASGYTDGDGDFILKVQYRFHSPDEGKTVVKKTSATRNDLKNAALPGAGTRLTIVYANKRFYQAL